MSLERFLGINFAMDFALLAVSARCCGVFRLRRIVCAAALTALYGALAAAAPTPWAAAPVQVTLLASVSMLNGGRFGFRYFAAYAAVLSAAAAIAGGTALAIAPALASIHCAPFTAIPGLLFALMLLRHRNPLRSQRTIVIALRVDARVVRFPALIDTGNLLREPRTGMPVIIAESRMLGPVLPVAGCRTIPYGSLGGTGLLECFRPSDAWCEQGLRRRALPDFWVAVVPGFLPGPAGALAPCEFSNLS